MINAFGKNFKQSCFVMFRDPRYRTISFRLCRQISDQKQSDIDETRLTLYQHVKHIRQAPLPTMTYGLLGLIPFVAVPSYFLFTQSYCPTLAHSQCMYGATILSFLGGIRWGSTLYSQSGNRPTWKNLGISVTPSLIAWVGLMASMPISTLTVMTGLAGMMYFDIREAAFPSWFKGMRFILSSFAVLSLWTTFMCYFTIQKKEKQTESSDE